jgi:Gram-negative bacterial TonB protein C-terminal
MVAAKEGCMRRNSKLILAVLLLISAEFAATGNKVSAGSHFAPPDVIAVSDIPYPIDSIASGVVSLGVVVSETGQVAEVHMVRGVSGLAAGAINAVNTWTFSPGKLDGVAVPSVISVQVIFNPGTLQSQNLPLPELTLTAPPLPLGDEPPQMAQAFYAVYPANSVATGTVVLDLLINKFSQVKQVTPIRAVPSLTEAAIAAVKTWTVNPATMNEKKLSSNLIAAFVFRSPSNSTP